jgi:hypothetical protein
LGPSDAPSSRIASVHSASLLLSQISMFRSRDQWPPRPDLAAFAAQLALLYGARTRCGGLRVELWQRTAANTTGAGLLSVTALSGATHSGTDFVADCCQSGAPRPGECCKAISIRNSRSQSQGDIDPRANADQAAEKSGCTPGAFRRPAATGSGSGDTELYMHDIEASRNVHFHRRRTTNGAWPSSICICLAASC